MKKLLFILLILSFCSFSLFAENTKIKSKGNAYFIFFDNPWRTNIIDNVYGLNLGLPIAGKTTNVEGYDLGFFYSSVSNVYGLQTSILSNDSNLFDGVQASFIWNTTQKDFNGIQISGYNIVKKNFNGLQAGVVCNIQHDCAGLQLATINTVNNKLEGAQIGLLNWATMYLEGFQIGGLNIVKRLNGFQIGLINKAKSGSGLQIGLFNYIEDSFIPFLPIINYHNQI